MRFAEAPQRATRRPRECERTRQRSECGCRHGRGIPATRGPIGRASAPSAGPEAGRLAKILLHADHLLGPCGPLRRDPPRVRPVRSVVHTRLFRVMVPISPQRPAGPGRVRPARFPLRVPLASRPLRPRVPGSSRGEGHPGPAPGLPDAVPRGGAPRPRVHAGSSAPAPERRSRSTASRSRSSP